MIGPGKYDDACTLVREMTDATCAVVVVIGGSKGSGFSVQTAHPISANTLAVVLETVARQLRESQQL
jgi:hypothetical protein